MATKTVTGKLTSPSGANVSGELVTATLSVACIIASTQEVAAIQISTLTASDGTWSLTLQANADLTPSTSYYTITAGVGFYCTAIVPQSAGPFKLEDIMAAAPVPSPTVGYQAGSNAVFSSVTLDATSPFTVVALPGDVALQGAASAFPSLLSLLSGLLKAVQRNAPRQGNWIWFTNPRASRFSSSTSSDKTYFGRIHGDSTASIASVDHVTGTLTDTVIAAASLLAVDDHNNPAIIARHDRKLMAFITPHIGSSVYYWISSSAEDISAWAARVDINASLGGGQYSYANPVQLCGEAGNPIYLFYRAYTPTPGTYFSKAADPVALSWAAQTQLYVPGGGARPYVLVAPSGPTPTDYQTAVLADTPVGYWRLGGGTSMLDYSGHSDHGALNGGVTRGVFGALINDANGAITLDGVNGSYIGIPTATWLHPGDTFSLECWFKTTLASVQVLIDAGTTDYSVQMNGSGQIICKAAGGSTVMTSAAGFKDGLWHHVVWTKAAATNHLYVDGADITPTVTNATITATANDVTIGRATATFNGSLDEVAIYNTALTAARVLAHYQSGIQRAENRIDLFLSDAHPGDSPFTCSLYHCYYTGGSFYKSDGTLITTAYPFGTSDLTRIYDGSVTPGWNHDIAMGLDGKPVVVYETMVAGSWTDHQYYYARWNGTSWVSTSLGSGGTYLISGEQQYSGGLCLDHSDPSKVWMSMVTSGQWEIWYAATNDSGATFRTTQMTYASAGKNFRPVVPRNASPSLPVLYAYGHYTRDYTWWDTVIKSLSPY